MPLFFTTLYQKSRYPFMYFEGIKYLALRRVSRESLDSVHYRSL